MQLHKLIVKKFKMKEKYLYTGSATIISCTKHTIANSENFRSEKLPVASALIRNFIVFGIMDADVSTRLHLRFPKEVVVRPSAFCFQSFVFLSHKPAIYTLGVIHTCF
jgi:hypothetical protein